MRAKRGTKEIKLCIYGRRARARARALIVKRSIGAARRAGLGLGLGGMGGTGFVTPAAA